MKNTELTEGTIWKQLLLFSMPILFGNLLQNLYNSVDALVVGNFVDGTALAAVSVCSSVVQLLVGFFTGMSAGTSVVTARYYGAGGQDRLKEAVNTMVTFSVLSGTLLALIGILSAPAILNAMSVPSGVYDGAVLYLRIYLAGTLFTVIYNVAAGVLLSVGDSRSQFLILCISGGLNVVLDLVFVAAFSWGICGVALATVISQMISVILVFQKLIVKQKLYEFRMKNLRLEKELLFEVLGMGLPAGLQNSIVAVSNMFVWRYINDFGSAAMAGVGTAQKLDKFVLLPCQSFGLAITTYTGQNIGAGKYDRVFKGIRVCLLLSILSVALLGVPIYVFADRFVALFNAEPEVVKYGMAMVRVLVPFYGFQVMNQTYVGVTRGFGNSRVPMLASVFGMVVFRQLFLAIAMSIRHTVWNVYICYPVTWFLTGALVMGYFYCFVRFPYGKNR